MEVNECIIVLGYRGKAVSRVFRVVWQFILATLFFFVFIGLFTVAWNSGSPDPAGMTCLFIFYFPLPNLVALAGIRNIFIIQRNNAILDEPVLAYDKIKDVFYCHDRFGHPLTIPNGRIIALSGSKKRSDRELRMRFINDKGMMKRTCIGFCRNIDHNAVKILLNQYHRPPVR